MLKKERLIDREVLMNFVFFFQICIDGSSVDREHVKHQDEQSAGEGHDCVGSAGATYTANQQML
jgi:hypothetical protein